MGLFQHMTGVKFKKTGRQAKAVIKQRIAELRKRLSKRDRDLDAVMNDKALMRSFLLRETHDDYFQTPGQRPVEMPTEEHQRITELCRRIKVIEREISGLSVVYDNLQDGQKLKLSLEDVTRFGFSPEHYKTNVG